MQTLIQLPNGEISDHHRFQGIPRHHTFVRSYADRRILHQPRRIPKRLALLHLPPATSDIEFQTLQHWFAQLLDPFKDTEIPRLTLDSRPLPPLEQACPLRERCRYHSIASKRLAWPTSTATRVQSSGSACAIERHSRETRFRESAVSQSFTSSHAYWKMIMISSVGRPAMKASM